MTKNDLFLMGYEVLESKDDDMDTMFKKFESGSVWIFQFNENVQKETVGMIHLSGDQVAKLFG